MTKPTLGVAITAKNEAHYLEKCIQSVRFADEILVINTQSSDRTAELARNLGAKVITREDPGIRNQKQFALEQLQTDWILAIDPDEWLTPESQKEIQNMIHKSPPESGYQIPRFHIFMGQTIRHGKGVDHPLRLVRRGRGEYANILPHEYIQVEGSTGILKQPMIHDSTPSITSRLAKIQKETELELDRLPTEPPTPTQLFIEPLTYFLSMVVRQRGWKDGIPGIILIGLFAIQLFIMHAKFFEAHFRKRNGQK